MSNTNRNQYNIVIANTVRMLTLATKGNGVCEYECISHSTPQNNMYGRNDQSTSHRLGMAK